VAVAVAVAEAVEAEKTASAVAAATNSRKLSAHLSKLKLSLTFTVLPEPSGRFFFVEEHDLSLNTRLNNSFQLANSQKIQFVTFLSSLVANLQTYKTKLKQQKIILCLQPL
jgi:hypothetical protein